MNPFRRVFPLMLMTLLALGSSFGCVSTAWAHGDDDHSNEAPASPAADVPIMINQNKLVLSSDEVELVALADKRTLLIYLDRFKSNQPIVGASLILETNGEETTAQELHPGQYQIDAPWVETAGSYQLLITIDSDEMSDLLDGTLVIAPATNIDDQTSSAALDAATGVPLFGSLVLDSWQLGVGGATLLVVLVILFRVRPRATASTVSVAALMLVLASTPEPVMAHGGEDHSGDSSAENNVTPLSINTDKARRFSSGEVYLPKPNQRMLAITTQVATVENVATTYQLTAHVVASPNHSGQVQAAQNGRVDTATVPLPHLGQWVEQGQVVGHILPIAARFEQGNQQAQQAELSSSLRLAEKRYARLLKLKGSVPQKEIDEALNQVDSLKARLSAVVKSLRGLEPLYAPISGYITAVEVTPGQIVESQTKLFEIVNPSRMQVEALAYDRQTTLLESAYSVTRSGAQLELQLLGVGVNLKGHAIPMLFDVKIDNPPLAIGEALSVYVSGQQRTPGIVLPRSSLVKGNQGEDLVWTHPQAERFAAKAVRWSTVNKDQIVITDGLNEGDRVVIQGATLLSQIR